MARTEPIPEVFEFEDGRPPLLWVDARLMEMKLSMSATCTYMTMIYLATMRVPCNQATVADKMGISIRTVRTAMHELIKNGLITMRRRPNLPAMYTINAGPAKIAAPDAGPAKFADPTRARTPARAGASLRNTRNNVNNVTGLGDQQKVKRRDYVFEWVSTAVYGVEYTDLDRESVGLVNRLAGAIIRSEKKRIGLSEKQALTEQQNQAAAAELPGLVKHWHNRYPNLDLPRSPEKWALLVVDWYKKERPQYGASPVNATVPQADPKCPTCHGSGLRAVDGPDKFTYMEPCTCLKIPA